jgi:sporulation protein YabP
MAEITGSHGLRMEDRKKITMTGVSEVVRFEDNTVVLQTGLGLVNIHGQDLQLKGLSLEGGEAMVEGHITALIYEEPRERGIFGRFLR